MPMVKREFVVSRLTELYNKKWRSQGKTQKQFTEAIKRADPECGINEVYVSKMLNGVYAPRQKYLAVICKVLDVDISEFFPKTHDDRYEYSTGFADGLEGELEEYAVKQFKIDLTFFQGLRNIIPEFDPAFPMFAPLKWYDVVDENHQPYERPVFAEASATSKGQGLLQITKDGKTYFLSRFDLKFIRELQDMISRIAQKAFVTRQKAFDEAEAKANEEFWKKNLELNPHFADDGTLWETFRLDDEQLQDIDSAGIYSDKEAKRLKLPKDWRSRLNSDAEANEGKEGEAP